MLSLYFCFTFAFKSMSNITDDPQKGKRKREMGLFTYSGIRKKQFGSWIQNIFIHLCWIIIATLLIYYYYYCVLYFRTLQCVCVCVCHGNALFTKQETAGKQFLLLLLPSTFYLLSREEGACTLHDIFFWYCQNV